MKLYNPQYFTEQGQRPYNQDYLYPPTLSSETKVFIVCDGMGGLDKGEIASEIVAKSIDEFIKNNTKDSIPEELLQAAVNYAHGRLREYLENDTSSNSMGSTLTLLSFIGQNPIIAHLGDSRVYHIRNGEILFKTRDHRQILNMVEAGIITSEQAKTHPWRNRLSRAISAKKKENIHVDSIEVKEIENINSGDYFFMCTDGVLEQVSDEILCKILNSDSSNKEKILNLMDICKGVTKDNYSGILLQISDIN